MALKVGELYASFGIDHSELNKAMDSITDTCNNIASTLQKTGAGLSLAVTTPLVKLGKDTLQASIDFESAFAGVIKTTDSEKLKEAGMTFDDLADSIKKMSLVAPQTTTDLAKIMELGGQLGIEVTALAEFTETIAAMGVATNLTTEQASTMFAQFANITGMDQSQFDNLGSAIVALGNNFATTEADVMEFAMRIASTATNVGMSTEDMLGYSTAITSVGIQAAAGGTAFSKFMSNMQLAVEKGSDSLAQYAEVAGMSAEEFQKAFKDDAGNAIHLFIGGLSRMESEGKSAIAVLDELNIKDQYQRNILLSLMNSYENLSDALVMSTDAWHSNIALLKEANQRYATTESQMQIMKNALNLIKIELGDMALPFIKDMTKDVIRITEAFLGMDKVSKKLVVKMAALAAASGPFMIAAGTLVGMLPKIVPMLIAMSGPIGLVASGIGLFAVAAVDADNRVGKAFFSISRSIAKTMPNIEKSLTNAIGSVSRRIPLLSGSVVNGLDQMIPAVVDSASGIIESFLNVFTDNAVYFADIGTTAVTNLISSFAANAPTLIPSALNAIVSSLTALIQNAPDLIRAGGELASGIIQGIMNTDWLSLGQQILTAISDSLKDIGTTFQEKFESAKTLVETIKWSEVSTKIKDSFDIASDWLKGLILGDTLTESTTWLDVGKKICEWVKNGFGAAEGWLKNIILGDGATGDVAEDSSWSDIGTKILEKISASLSGLSAESLSGTIGDLSSIASTIIDKIVNSEADFAVGAGNLIAKLIAAVSSYTGWDTLSTHFTTFATNVVQSVSEGFGKVTGAAATIASSISSVISGITSTDIVTATSSVAGILIDGISTGVSSVVGAAATIAGAIASILEGINESNFGTSIGTLATDIFGYICDGINNVIDSPDMTLLMTNIGSGMKNAIASIGDIAGEIARYITSPEGAEKIVNAGKSLIGSLIMGIGIGLGSVGDGIVSAIHSILDGAISGIFEWFGIDADKFGFDAFQDTLFENTAEGILSAAQLSEKYLYNEMGTIIDQMSAYVALEAAGFGDELGNFNAQFSYAGIALVQALQSGMLSQQEATLAIAALISNGMADGLAGDSVAGKYYASGEAAMYAFIDAFGTGDDALIALCEHLGIEITNALTEDSLWEQTGDVLTDKLNSAVESASSTMYETGKKQVKESVIGGYADGAEESRTTVENAAKSITETISGLNDRETVAADSKETGKTAGAAIGEGFVTEQAAVQASVQLLVSMISTSYQPIVGQFALITNQAMTITQNVIKNMSPYIEFAVSSLRDSMITSFGTFSQEFANVSMTAMASVLAAITLMSPLAVVAVAGLQLAMTNAFLLVNTSFAEITVTAMSAVCSTVTKYTDPAKVAVKSLHDSMKNAYSPLVLSMTTITRNAMIGAKTGVTSYSPILTSATRSAMQSAVNAAKSIMSNSAGYSIGVSMMSGMVNGIRAMAGSVASAAVSAVSNALAAMRSTARINSPSKETEEYGKYMDLGAANGLLGGAMVAAAKKAVGETIKVFTAGAYVSDPSAGTVATARQSAAQTANANAERMTGSSGDSFARAVGQAMADRLIESGAIGGDINMNGDKVGEIVAKPVSRKINQKAKKTISGRGAQGVIA